MKTNQTGSGSHQDKRTKRNRDRSGQERQAVEEQLANPERFDNGTMIYRRSH